MKSALPPPAVARITSDGTATRRSPGASTCSATPPMRTTAPLPTARRGTPAPARRSAHIRVSGTSAIPAGSIASPIS